MAEETLDANSRLKQRMRAIVPPRNTSALRQSSGDHSPAPAIPELPKPTPIPAPKLVAFTLRVEETIDKGLKSLCNEEGITKETFLEAAFLACLDNESWRQQVLEIAQERRQERKDTGVLRRAKSMTRYLDD
ncbi:hypothetical protein [Microcoleus sp. SVA1_A1]|uniref:hypothetical protein n=1 Tax=Microcoleus sp. SVA1_A1 TaxID=2818946 RepID=UPI002FD01A2A